KRPVRQGPEGRLQGRRADHPVRDRLARRDLRQHQGIPREGKVASVPFTINRKLPQELAKAAEDIKGFARTYGLDFWDIIFEVLDYDELNEVAAYGGFPTRYPHWKFGMEYEQLSKGYSYGLQKIYELVINNDPCYAYLMKSNGMVDQKLVMAHVCGHA